METFHPTFLYESLWNFGLVLFLVWFDRRRRIRKGSLLAVYVLGYSVARLWLETVRIDFASEIAGVRVNIWMSLVGIVASVAWLATKGRRTGATSADAGAGAEEVEVAGPDDGPA